MTVAVRPLREADLDAADRVMRLAFGTFLGLPDPTAFMGDASFVRTRWAAEPAAAFGAEVDGELVGSNFATRWGSVGFFGPLSVRPDCWERGIASRLLEPVIALFDRWGTRHVGLFTFAQSPKHVHLYQKFDFWPRFLTAVMARPVEPRAEAPRWSKYSATPAGAATAMRAVCRELTDAILEGLDVGDEIEAARRQSLGDTVLLWDESRGEDRLAALAVCHSGPGTEAGSGVCFVKFGAVRPGPRAEEDFVRLLTACEAFGGERGAHRLVAGVNLSRHEAYRIMLARGFRTEIQGVVMQRGNQPAYNRAGVYLLDDWR